MNYDNIGPWLAHTSITRVIPTHRFHERQLGFAKLTCVAPIEAIYD